MQSFRRLISRSTLFVVAEFVQMGAGFLLLPLYTAYLSAADYGIVALSTTFGGVLAIFLLQPFQGMFSRLYFDLQDDDERRRFFGSTWLFLLIYSVLITGLIDLVGGALGSLGFEQVPYQPYLRLTVWTTMLTVVMLSLPRALFLVREQAWQLVGLNLSLFAVSTGLIVYFVVFLGLGAYGNLLGVFVGTVIIALPSLIITLRNVAINWRWSHIRRGLAFALPLAPHLLSLWVLNLSDRWILQQYVSLTELGIYAFGYLFGSIIQVIALALSEAISPYYYRIAGERSDATSLLTRLGTYYMFVVIWAAVGLTAMVREVIELMAARPEYHAATAIIPWIVLGCVARGFYFVFISAVYYAKKLGRLPLITVGAGAVNIGLNLLLVPHWGIMAAALTTFIAYALQAVLVYQLAQQNFPLPYEAGRLLILTGLGLVWGGLLFTFVLSNLWLSLTFKAFLALAFPLGLLAIRFFSAEELGALQRFRRSYGRSQAQA